jgi:hypothetical protein
MDGKVRIKTTTPNTSRIGSTWKLQLMTTNFTEWIKDRAHHSLFFDGSSKGNPRTIDVGGVIC